MSTWAAAGVMAAAKETTRRERRNPWCNSSPQTVSNRWIEGSRSPNPDFLVSLRYLFLAEREGFEPPIPLRVCRISSAVLSTTQPPLRSLSATSPESKRAIKSPNRGRFLTKRAKTDKGCEAYIEPVDQPGHPRQSDA